MSSYRCVLLLLVACMAAVCMDGGEAVTVRQIVNVGDNYTFYCYDNFTSTITYQWYRSGIPSGYFISSLTGTSVSYYSNFQNHERVSSSYSNGRFSLTVLNMTIADSGSYFCTYNNWLSAWVDIVEYNTHVIGCSCAVTKPYVLGSGSENVTCILDNFPPPSFSPPQDTITSDPQIRGTIKDNELTFSTNNDLMQDLEITLFLSNYDGSCSCLVPALPLTAITTQRTTPFMPTSVTSSTDYTTTPPSTSYPSSSNYVSRTPNVSSSTISHLMAPDEHNNQSQRTLIIAISAVGSTMILLLIIVIILLRSRKRQEHAPNHSLNGTKEEKGEVGEIDMCYTSIQDTSSPERFGGSRNTEIKAPTGERDSNKDLSGSGCDNDGMVDNILYDFTSDYRGSRAIADPSTVDACGPLYTMPDKTSKSADRASVMSKRDHGNGQEVMHPSLASRGGGDVTPSQNGAPRCEDETGDDDGGVAALYAVPDKGPGSRKKAVTHSFAEAADGTGANASYVNVNLSSNTTQPEPGDIAALYAVVDKREKS